MEWKIGEEDSFSGIGVYVRTTEAEVQLLLEKFPNFSVSSPAGWYQRGHLATINSVILLDGELPDVIAGSLVVAFTLVMCHRRLSIHGQMSDPIIAISTEGGEIFKINGDDDDDE